MKRVLALLAVVCALLSLGACSSDINLSVDASADLTYDNGTIIHIDPVTYDNFHRRSLSNDDLEWIFTNLIQHADPNFRAALLHLEIYDDITGEYLRSEDYGVVYNSYNGCYDFASMDWAN